MPTVELSTRIDATLRYLANAIGLATQAAGTILGRASGAGTGQPTALTGAQVTTIIDGITTLRTAAPGAPTDDTWWITRTGSGPYTITLNVRISGATKSFDLGTTDA